MTLGDRCDEIVRLIDETLGGMTTPVPARRRRLTADPAAGPVPGRGGQRLADTLVFDPDAGPSAA